MRPTPPAPLDRVRPEAWRIVALVAVAPLLLLLALALWQTPFAISETVALLEDVQRGVARYLDPATTYFRPLFYLSLAAVWRGVDTPAAALALFKALHIAVVLTLAGVFFAHLKPRSPIDAAAASVAMAVLLGAPAFRENLENLPLNQMMVVMLLTLGAWIVTTRSPRWWHAPLLAGLTAAAIGFKEQGLLIAPMVLAAWLTRAPGVNAVGACASVGVAAGYLVTRVATSAAWPTFGQDVGFGFAMLPADEAAARFGPFPVAMYAYNAVSTAANVVASEPSAGVFRIVQHVVEGRVEAWEVNHLLSSCAMTALLAWWGVATVRCAWRDGWTTESRVAIAALVTLFGSAALGFNYARDRAGGVAVVFYALASFFAVRAVLERMGALRARGVALTAAALVVLAASWQVRAVGTLEYARETAAKNRKEWMVTLARRRADFADRPVYLRTLDALKDQGITPSAAPTPYPRWVFKLLGQR